jgi:hypothetical protein
MTVHQDKGSRAVRLPVALLGCFVVPIGWIALAVLCVQLASGGVPGVLVALIALVGFFVVPAIIMRLVGAAWAPKNP